MKKTQKRIVSLLLAGSIALSPASGGEKAADASGRTKKDPETGLTYLLEQGSTRKKGDAAWQTKITGYDGESTELVIPAEVEGHKVTAIEDKAFQGNATITSVTIQSGITRIGHQAFQGCQNLQKVILPATITDWRDSAGNDYKSSAFQGCTALSQLTLPEGLASIGQNAFQGCTALDNLTIPASTQTIRDTAFAGCTSLQNLELKEGIREIGHQAFQGARGCPQLKELDIPPSVEDISYAFTDCAYLEKITLHEGIKTIGTNACKNCAALKEANIPDTVTTIQASAYSGCTALERLVLPPLATTLEGGITSGCTSLRELYILAEKVKWFQPLSLASEGKLYCIGGSSTYGIYQKGMAEDAKSKLTAIPTAGAEAAGNEYTYDGSPRLAATLKGTQEGDEIRYRLGDGDYQKDMPQISEPGTYAVEITVKRQETGKPMQYSSLRAQAIIRKRQQTMHLSDIKAEEGESYAVTAEGYQGTGEPVYTYYMDAACTQPVSGKPEAAGEYYVRASVPETDYDLAVQSNTAKITIHKKEAPGANPGTSPEPDASEEPGGSPGASGEPDAGQTPGMNPGGTPNANATPDTEPGANATASPEPGTQPGASPTPGGRHGAGAAAAKGTTFMAGGLKYKITSAAKGKATAQVKAPKSKKAKSIAIPATVKKNGTTYAVTSVGACAFKNCRKLKKATIGKNVATIGKSAFSGCKALKKIVVKTARLKKVGKNALKGIHRKAVFKVPKKKLKKYRRLWKGKGQKGTVRIK